MTNYFDADEILYTYGHSYSEAEIKGIYPYSGTEIKKQHYVGGSYRITYDCHTAYQLRKKNVPVVAWGAKDRGRDIFVFRTNKPKGLKF